MSYPKTLPLLDPQDCLLLVIDVQEKLFPLMVDKEDLQKNLLRLATFCKIMHIPMLSCEQIKLGDTIADLQQEIPDFSPIGKDSFSCFGCAEFKQKLGQYGRKSLILTGIEAHICVLQTALQGLQEYRVQVICDAMSSRFAHNKEIALDRLSRAGVELSTTEMFVFEILQKAGTDEFRQAYKLIK